MVQRFVTVFFLLVANLVTAQNGNILTRYLDYVFNDTSDKAQPKFLAYPTLAYTPETSWEAGIAGLYVFYTKRDTANRLNEIYGFTFATLENQYGIWLDNAFYSDKSRWINLGRLRFQRFPLLYYGIGPSTTSEYLGRVDARQFLWRERLLRQIGGLNKNLYFGFEFDFQQLSQVDFQRAEGASFSEPRGSRGSGNLGLGLGLVYDERHNILNVRSGVFTEVAWLRYSPVWFSDFNFSSVFWDSRFYRPVNKRDVLALQVAGQFSFGEVPFNMLALMGGESLMRGYYLGRYRDSNLMAAQIEYRFLPLPLGFTDRIGAAVFMGAGSVFPDFGAYSLNQLVYAGGAGLRLLLFPDKDVYTRFDVAFTEEGPGFYLYIGESF